MALNTRRVEESVWAPPPGEVTTLVAVTAGTWPAGTRLLVGDPSDTPATATVLGSSVVSADGLTATWALSEADCAILRSRSRFMVQVPSGAAWEGILAGTVNLEPAWSGGRAVQRLGTVMVGPQGPAGAGGASGWPAGITGPTLRLPAGPRRLEDFAYTSGNMLTLTPLVVSREITYTSVGVQVTYTTAAGAVRLGLYQASGANLSRVVDWGTVDATLGRQTITATGSIPVGVYWVAGVRTASGRTDLLCVAETQPVGSVGGTFDTFLGCDPPGWTYGDPLPATIAQTELYGNGASSASMALYFGGVVWL